MNHRARLSFAVLSGAALGLLCLFYFFQHSGSSLAAPQPRVATPVPVAPQWDWNVACVDCPRQFNAPGHQSMAMDESGVLHIIYGEDHLYHAWQDGSGWQVEVVDPSVWVGIDSSLAIDSQGYLHASYIGIDPYRLCYAYQDASGWHSETVAEAFPGELTLALNADDEAQIVYNVLEPDHSRNLMIASRTSADWSVQAIGSPPLKGELHPMALDGSGHPHLIYQDGDSGALNYAAWNGSAWITETIASATSRAALVLDASDNPQVAYTAGKYDPLLFTFRDASGWHEPQVVWEDVASDKMLTTLSLSMSASGEPVIAFGVSGTPVELKFARQMAGEWQLESLLSDEAVHYSAMIVETSGATEQVHISYFNGRDNVLKHVYQAPAGWLVEVVDRVGKAGIGASMVLDAQGYAHFSYRTYSPEEDTLRYAYQDATGFHMQTVSAGPFGLSDLALDSNENPHIAYNDMDIGQVRYAHKTTAGWQDEIIAGGWGPSLALDAQDYPHIAYNDEWGMQYAYQDAQGWHFDTIDNNQSLVPSLVLDESGKAHLSYHRRNPNDLMYAVQTDSGWTLQPVEDSGVYGDYSSLALDGDGRPHIGYYSYDKDSNTGDLKYAYWNGTGWEITTVDSSQDSGREVSMALSSKGVPLMSYRSGVRSNSGELRFAYLEGSEWYTQTVDDDGDFNGLYISLALDEYDNPYIGYYISNLGDLRYAFSFTPSTPGAVTINGPLASLVGAGATFTATVQPDTTLLPLEYTWQATDGLVVENSNGLGDQSNFIWATSGVKTIQVSATNQLGTATGTFTVTIHDVAIGGLAASNDSPTPIGQATSFQASVQSGTNVSYTWDFGDGATASGATVTHLYPAAQTYLATVTASNSAGSQTATTEVLVESRRLFLPGILNK
jgi:hypothetical protein